jgi:hypothetical protein
MHPIYCGENSFDIKYYTASLLTVPRSTANDIANVWLAHERKYRAATPLKELAANRDNHRLGGLAGLREQEWCYVGPKYHSVGPRHSIWMRASC